MDDEARNAPVPKRQLLLNKVNHATTQQKALSQIYYVSPNWAQNMYGKLSSKRFGVFEVEKDAEGADPAYMEKKFRPKAGDAHVGFAPESPIYRMYT